MYPFAHILFSWFKLKTQSVIISSLGGTFGSQIVMHTQCNYDKYITYKYRKYLGSDIL